ncbi:hypothetical protein A2U01_0111556, partial [Trifolium medium]|nr:hypothetical protein [Trifolium medium]
AAQHRWENALAQLRIVNPSLEFSIERMGMLWKVVDGQIIIPDEYKQMELDDEEDDEVEEGDNVEEGLGEG